MTCETVESETPAACATWVMVITATFSPLPKGLRKILRKTGAATTALRTVVPQPTKAPDQESDATMTSPQDHGAKTVVSLLAPTAIRLNATAQGWEDAVRQAGALLESEGVATSDYTQAMVDSIHTNGPYIVLAPGFAFAHARPSEAVHRTGLSWLRLAEPVEFGHKRNDPVELVVAMAAADSTEHQAAMAQLAKVVSSKPTMERLRTAPDAEAVLAILAETTSPRTTPAPQPANHAEQRSTRGRSLTKDHIMTVCGNGVGTSLFLKNTVEGVLQKWGWGPFITVEATDTVSAKGKAKECDLIMTSGEIGKTLGDLGVPMVIIENFTSEQEVDAALREMYDI